MRHAVAPLPEICQRLMRYDVPIIDANTHPYFRGRLRPQPHHAGADRRLREMVKTLVESKMLLNAMKQNEVMKQLAAWAAMLAVPTAIAGIYGMNFKYMPELDWRFGYPVTVAVIFCLCGFLYWRFHKAGCCSGARCSLFRTASSSTSSPPPSPSAKADIRPLAAISIPTLPGDLRMSSPQAPIDSDFRASSTAEDVIKGHDLSGKTILVTGGYAGLGLESVRVFTAAGAKVTVPARDLAKAAPGPRIAQECHRRSARSCRPEIDRRFRRALPGRESEARHSHEQCRRHGPADADPRLPRQ